MTEENVIIKEKEIEIMKERVKRYTQKKLECAFIMFVGILWLVAGSLLISFVPETIVFGMIPMLVGVLFMFVGVKSFVKVLSEGP